jgi:hypothetical protein
MDFLNHECQNISDELRNLIIRQVQEFNKEEHDLITTLGFAVAQFKEEPPSNVLSI